MAKRQAAENKRQTDGATLFQAKGAKAQNYC